MSDVDKALAEIDITALADAVGVLKSRHVELPTSDPAVPDTQPQRSERQGRAGQRALGRRNRYRNSRATDRALGVSKYPDAFETYCAGDVWHPEPTEEQTRQAANDLVAQGWPTDVVARLLRIKPRS